MTHWLAAMAAAGLMVGFGLCEAADYAFTLPQVLGYPQGEQNLSVNLGGEFTNISGARLRITGWHTPGLLADLNSAETYPYPAAIDVYSPAEPFGHSGILGELLPSVVGPFEVDEAFQRISPGGQPNFDTWFDGMANFYFSAGPSAYLAIYRTIVNPAVSINSATLVVTGERSGAAVAPTADFDGDGMVDGDDLGMWQTAFGQGITITELDADNDGDSDGADFLTWQRQLGSPAPDVSANAPVPEPATLTLIVLAAAGWRLRRRRSA